MIKTLLSHWEYLLAVLVILVFCIRAYILVRRAKTIDKDGILTEAVVTRIEENWRSEPSETSYSIYVQYSDANGAVVENVLAAGTDKGYSVGQKVRIRYLPGEDGFVRPAEEEK
ncbi:MAG: hypothetical protein Q4F09_04510 [Erysipelotrichaceae bacterium]|nr:hypothetical protein [Erysipelotrichaceae bacterium]